MSTRSKHDSSADEDLYSYEDELKRNTAEEIYEAGLEWICENDRAFFDACCKELQARVRRNESRSASKWLSDLRAEAPPQWTGRRTPAVRQPPASAKFSESNGSISLHMNHGITQIRREMIASAEFSLCLSTWHFGSNDADNLVGTINEACQKTSLKEILLVVGWQPKNPNRHRRIRQMLRALDDRVSIHRVSKNHSKLVIADRQRVLLGSANLSPVVSDEVAVYFNDKYKANELRQYLLSLEPAEDHTPI